MASVCMHRRACTARATLRSDEACLHASHVRSALEHRQIVTGFLLDEARSVYTEGLSCGALRRYGPGVYMQSYFRASNFPQNMEAVWDEHFAFVQARIAVACHWLPSVPSLLIAIRDVMECRRRRASRSSSARWEASTRARTR